jgi:hypothetical protein
MIKLFAKCALEPGSDNDMAEQGRNQKVEYTYNQNGQ